MADLEAVLADVSYLMAMEKSKGAPAARAVKKLQLPEPSIRSLMMKYLIERGLINFDEVFDQQIGYLLFKEYCTQSDMPIPQLEFYDEISTYKSLDLEEDRASQAKMMYDKFVMKKLLQCIPSEFSKYALDKVRAKLHLNQYPSDLFQVYDKEIRASLKESFFDSFVQSERFTRYLQWKNVELSLRLSMNDFSVHRIIGRGGFGEVYGCRKADTGTMYAMKCLDKKRIKLKQGESLSLNERSMLQMVDSPFIVCISYAFQSPDKLCFVLDLMNGGDLHYQLTQRGVFTENEVRFYASEILLGLDHMHQKGIVYRDLKPANILLDERGHTKISDLGLACDLSKKKPHASVGTHGYIAPEVLMKGVSYDAGADWFSYGCTLFKLLRGHSPFRNHKTKDKAEIDKMTLTTEVKMPDSMSPEVASFLTGLLIKDPQKRLGCTGRGGEELKESAFFKDVDWEQVFRQKYIPPLTPPRGEVNAADAFDIGNFDDDETKGIKLCDNDQELYKDFDLVVSSRWQKEICDTVFSMVNHETDKLEAKRKSKAKYLDSEILEDDCVLHGVMHKLGGPLTLSTWQKRYFFLYPNRLEWKDQEGSKSLVVFESVTMIKEGQAKGMKYCIFLTTRDSNKDLTVRCETEPEFTQWSQDLMKTWCQAKRVLKKGPKLISMQRSVAGDANYNKAILAAQTKSVQSMSVNMPSYRHKLLYNDNDPPSDQRLSDSEGL